MRRLTNIKNPIIYLITQGNLTSENYQQEESKTLQIIKFASAIDISLIQIREKNLTAKLVFELTTKAVDLTKGSKTKILVNDRADIASAAKAAGVHLTSNSIPVSLIRQNFSDDLIIGVSTHSFEKAAQARDDGADFVTFSPIFPPISKPKFSQPKGLETLREVCRKLKHFPVLALGGIQAENFRSAIDQGAHGFAGISFLNNIENLRKLNAGLR